MIEADSRTDFKMPEHILNLESTDFAFSTLWTCLEFLAGFRHDNVICGPNFTRLSSPQMKQCDAAKMARR